MKEKATGRFAYSRDGESYFGDERTIEDAIRAAAEDYEAERLPGVWIAELTELRADEEDVIAANPADGVVDALNLLIGGRYGEAGCDWPNAGKEECGELNRMLAPVVVRWLTKCGLHPSFSSVINPHTIKEIRDAQR